MRGRCRRAHAAQRRCLLRGRSSRERDRRQRGADQLAFEGGGSRLHPARLRRAGPGVPRGPAGADCERASCRSPDHRRCNAPRSPAGVRATACAPVGDGRQGAMVRLGRGATGAGRSGQARGLDDLHIRHHGCAQGRDAPASEPGAARNHGSSERHHIWAETRCRHRRAHERANVPLGHLLLRDAGLASSLQHRAATTVRRGGPAASDRTASRHAHAHGPHHVRATAASARGDETPLRSLIAALRRARSGTLSTRHQAGDDPMVGSDHQRVLWCDGDRHRGVAFLGGGPAQAGHGRPGNPGRHRAHPRCRRPHPSDRRGRRGVRAPNRAPRLHLPSQRGGPRRGRPRRARNRRRRGLSRRGRLSVPVRSQARHGDLGRGQHLSRGDRGRPDRHGGRARLCGVRHSRRRVRRAAVCLHRGRSRTHVRCRGRARLPEGETGELQGAEGRELRRVAAERRQRQDLQAPAARCPTGRRGNAESDLCSRPDAARMCTFFATGGRKGATLRDSMALVRRAGNGYSRRLSRVRAGRGRQRRPACSRCPIAVC